MIRAGFMIFGRGGWTGGTNYLRTTLQAIQEQLADQVQSVLLLSPTQIERYGPELVPWAHSVVVDKCFATWGRGRDILPAAILGRVSQPSQCIRVAKIDVLFENASYFGWRTGVAAVAWMPDFQHMYMPEMFSFSAWWQRQIGFRIQVASRKAIMLSSESARRDCERFYPAARGKTYVVRFGVRIDPTPILDRGPVLREKYALPERYFYMPNQFWRHKNHRLVVEALTLLRNRGELHDALPVIGSGRSDPNHPEIHAEILALIGEHELRDHYRHLGLIPYDDVLGLIGGCDAMINPSFFEGWSTPIEEAKALGAKLLLANLEVNREQASDAMFFSPDSAEELANKLLLLSRKSAPIKQAPSDLIRAQDKRIAQFAQSLLEVIRAVTEHRERD
jgi:glycosyltransferase involved in cell wall biosynthesis